MSGKHSMSEFKIEAVKAAPAIGGATTAAVVDNVHTVFAGLTWSEIAAAATVVYVIIQIIVLLVSKAIELRRWFKNGCP